MPRSLRFWLSLGLSTLVALAIVTVIAVLLGVLLPRLHTEVENNNRALGKAAAAQIDRFLANFSSQLARLADDISTASALTPAQLHMMIDTLAHADITFEAVYLIDGNGRVLDIGLPRERRAQSDNQIGVDFSGRGFVRTALQEQRAVWSDTYLSARGRTVVALAVPLVIPVDSARARGVLVGELNLDEISRFADLLSSSSDVLPIIVDRRSQVVGHPDATRALRQENFGHLTLLSGGAATQQAARFRLEEVDYIGSTTPIGEMGWTALIAQPTEKAFATVRSTLLALAVGSLIALLLAMIVAIVASRYMMRWVKRFTALIGEVANGNYQAQIPRSGIREIENLARSMRSMAAAVLDREKDLQLAASVFTHAREGIIITDACGTIIEVNETFTLITGYSREEAIGQNPRLLKSGRQPPEFYEAMWQALIHMGHWSGEIWNRRKNGEVYAEILTISAVRDATGTTQHYVALATDITSVKEQQRQLEHIAHYDALTSLPNRVLLADRLRQSMIKSLRHGQTLAVAYLDLDNFKLINDTYGHAVGDELLIAFSQRMKEMLREGDSLSRIGGDEFVAVMAELGSPHDCAPVLERLLQAAAEPVVVGETMVHVSASIGVTFFPQDNVDAEQLMRHADQSMYQAKQTGKNRYHFYDVEHDMVLQARRESLDNFHRALEQHEFVLYYQPKVNMKTGEVIGAEALIRWQHPQKGLLPPGAFLPIIEDHPISVDLGEWVIDAALRQIAQWHAAGLRIPVSVNISAYQLQQGDFASRLSTLLDAHPDIDPASLELEILETSALEDVIQISRLMHACRALGVRFALDDFGTGYSSLTYLKRLPAEMLKIDQSFVRDMLGDRDDLAIVEAIVGLALAFRRNVIAEGVETIAHGELLLLLGCELAQGYAIARPMPGNELIAWIKSWRPAASWTAWRERTPNRDDLMMFFAELDHRHWLTGIENFLAEKDIQPTQVFHECRFGNWLATEGRARYGEHPEFVVLNAMHEQVHALGQQLVDLHVQGDESRARVLLGELHVLSAQLIQILRGLVQSELNIR